MVDERKIIQCILVNYKDWLIEDVLENVRIESVNTSRPKVLQYLQTKFNLRSRRYARGQRNYWIMRGFSEAEAEKEFKNYSSVYASMSLEAISKSNNVDLKEAKLIRKQRVEQWRNTWAKKDESEIAEINARKAQTLENFITRHGKDEGPQLYKEYRDRIALSNSLEGYIEKYGDIEGRRRYEKFRSNLSFVNSYEGYVDRFGEDADRLWNETCSKKAKSQTLRGYIDRYGDSDGRRRFSLRQERYLKSYFNKSPEELERIHKSKGITDENYLLKHGEDALHKRIETRGFGPGYARASRESSIPLLRLYKFARRKGISRNEIFIGIGRSTEFYLKDGSNFYLYDFTIPSIGLIVEYHGIIWHGLSENDDRKSPYGIDYVESYKRDQRKRKLAEDRGFSCYNVIWSTEDIDKRVHEIKEQIYEAIKNHV